MRWSEPPFRVRLIRYDRKKMIESKQKKEEWKWTDKPLKIAELTVDEAYAREFVKTASTVHHFKTSQWKDIRIDILI